MKKYVPRQPETIVAVQWFKHGDHPQVHRNPNDTNTGLLDNDIWAIGYSLTDTTVINPGDYVIEDFNKVWSLSEDDFNNYFREYVE